MNERMSVKGELRTRIHIKFSFNAFNLLFIDIINVAFCCNYIWSF